MMMDSVTEKYSFGVGQKLAEFRGIPVSRISLQNVFQAFSDSQVVFKILIPENIPAALGRFSQVVDKRLLF